MSEDFNPTTETEVAQSADPSTESATQEQTQQKEDVTNLLKALKSEREARKTYERQIKEKEKQLERFAEINPDEFKNLQAEAAKAAEIESRYGESIRAIEEKYGRQAAEAEAKAKAAESQISQFKKKYALEKIFNVAGGRTDAAEDVSFFDMFAEQMSAHFNLENDGTIVVVDSQGDPVLDSETGKRIAPEDFISSFKTHPVYGTFFKGVKGTGAGLTYGGTDANGQPVEDLASLSNDELFMKAFGN